MIETIDINAKEWFDRINGNSYFSAVIILNYGKPDAEKILVPFQYGYGEHYIDIAKACLVESNKISVGHAQPLWRYCQENNIILRTYKQTGCKKRELLNYSR